MAPIYVPLESSRPDAAVVYRGPSRLDGSPIVAVLTGTRKGSANRKTGPMAQLWILPDPEHAGLPTEAAKSGADASVCGDCPLRPIMRAQGKGGCYVNLGQAPQAVARKVLRGGYPYIDARSMGPLSVPLRFGAWGDPAALPLSLIRTLVRKAEAGHTGYTHAWRRFPALKAYMMASVDTVADAREATRKGWRFFQVLPMGHAGDAPEGTIYCPATSEGGYRTTCDKCRLCAGAGGAKSIAILAHGAGAARIGGVA